MSTHTPTTASGVLRRWILSALLFVLVWIAVWGAGDVLSWLFGRSTETWMGASWLAVPLAYTFIGGPLAVLLGWLIWRRLDETDRWSYAWSLYVGLMYTLALINMTVSLLSVLEGLLNGDYQPWSLGHGIAWLIVFAVHFWMLHSHRKHPLRLRSLGPVLGAAFGLGVAAFNAVRALQQLIDQALTGAAVGSIGTPWWVSVLGAVIWFAGGALIWWWHWRRDGVRELRGGFADVVLLITGVFAAGSAALIAAGGLLSLGMQALWDRAAHSGDLAVALSFALATAVIAALVWFYHRRVAAERSEGTRTAVRLIESGLGIVGLASGLGVVINAALASVNEPLAGSGALTLLFNGIASMIVGGIVWFLAWKPQRVDEGAGDPARRIYLIVIFGAAAVAALGALLVLGYRLFELALGDGGSVIENIRTPLGVLLATVLAAGYHFMIWRRDRALAPAAVTPVRRIDQVTLVAGAIAPEVSRAIADATGARVALMPRADADGSPTAESLVAALEGVQARRVLIVAGESIQVIPLAD